MMRELDGATTKEDAKKPTQQAIEQAERNATLLIEEEEEREECRRRGAQTVAAQKVRSLTGKYWKRRTVGR